MNNSLLCDKAYVEKVKETVNSVMKKYALPVYDLNNIENIPKQEIQFTIDDGLFFEQILLEVRGKTIPYAAGRKKKKIIEEKTLIKQIYILEELTQDSPTSLVLLEMLDEYKKNLEILRKEKLQGLMLRSKVNWIEHGEKPSKYFCSLEKRNYINKTVTKIIDDTGKNITEQKPILKEIARFYEQLYSSRDHELNNVNLNDLINHPVPKLSKEESQLLEGKLTYDEVVKAVKSMKNGKSPGTDGFTSEFYKFFWIDIGHFLTRALNHSFDAGELSVSLKQGIISIIPKGNKPREFLKNWRPISLLNTSYKILSTVLANRIKKVLDKLINENQKGFLEGRFIEENTRLLYDIMNFSEKNNITGILLLIDFEKAFDSISWRFMYNVLDFFHFGHDFKKWISILYKDAKQCVIQNGIFSQFFNISRGCRQGDPISPYIFILCVEIMGILIRQNNKIKGITIDHVEYKLFQYADDTGMFLDGTVQSLKNALDLLDQFAKYSGLTPNFDKTKCIWIGSAKGCTDKLCEDRNLQWSNDPFTVLGITFSTDLYKIPDLNFRKKLENIQKLITYWKKRNLTVLGRICVVKTLLISKLVHLFTSIPSPNAETITNLETILFNYIWNA